MILLATRTRARHPQETYLAAADGAEEDDEEEEEAEHVRTDG